MRVLVLNMDYSPINITSLRRGFALVFKGKAEIIIRDESNPINTYKNQYERPSVIRLLKYVSRPFIKVHLNRQNVFKRDGHKCVYCGSVDNLTIDHLIPKSRGGQNSWSNLITSCNLCNVRKGDKDLEIFLSEYGLGLTHKPFKPSHTYFMENSNKMNPEWKQFMFNKKNL